MGNPFPCAFIKRQDTQDTKMSNKAKPDHFDQSSEVRVQAKSKASNHLESKHNTIKNNLETTKTATDRTGGSRLISSLNLENLRAVASHEAGVLDVTPNNGCLSNVSLHKQVNPCNPFGNEEMGRKEKQSCVSDEKILRSSSLVTPPIRSNGTSLLPQLHAKSNSIGIVPPSTIAHGFRTDTKNELLVSKTSSFPDKHVGNRAAPLAASPNPTSQRKQQNKTRGVPHVYHDFSQVPGPGLTCVRKKTGGVTQPFPEKLHDMLDQESSDDPSSAIISWLPHGRAFIVRRPKEFTSQIMPKYFRQSKLTSFQRQLNLYGFRRITQGADSGAYYHELFLQGRPSLSQRMVRQKVKGTGHKQPADVGSEPNFYSMPSVHREHGAYNENATIWPQDVQPKIPETQKIVATSVEGQANRTFEDPSGYESLRGAASLLHGFASSLIGTTFLGPIAQPSEATQTMVSSTEQASKIEEPTNKCNDVQEQTSFSPRDKLKFQG